MGKLDKLKSQIPPGFPGIIDQKSFGKNGDRHVLQNEGTGIDPDSPAKH